MRKQPTGEHPQAGSCQTAKDDGGKPGMQIPRSKDIYFTTGGGGYKDGLLGIIQLQVVPKPSTAVLGLISVALLAARWWRKRRRYWATA